MTTYKHDWYEEMPRKQEEVVRDFVKKGWVITGMTEKHEILLDNSNVSEDRHVHRTARIPLTPY